MRKFQKKQLLENIKLLQTAGRMLSEQKSVIQKNYLCTDMQDVVLAILNFLDNVTDNDPQLTELFSDLCRLLEDVSQEKISSKQAVTQIDKIADYIKLHVKTERIEVVFFCYKASMSDCLESIYLAAKQDRNCDAYFIPIPYYDKNSDGSLGKMHYEAEGCYSDQYELTDWRTYDVEKRHPDVVFIMNPYDEYNYVTTVHSDFYASRLKGCTEFLIYVPYFIHYEKIDPNSGGTRGVVLADRVIVQSENVKKQYISSMLSLETGITPELAMKKVVALGSPKMDKVLNSKKEDYMLPESWKKIIERGKKGKLILLYNLSVGTALHNSQGKNERAYLNKLRSVFEFFKDRDDVILWWRPHPLLDQSFRAMRPELYQEYQELVKKYKEQKLGIYDDSADMNRAIAYADACLGDGSSVNLLMQFIGKPVLIQNMNNAGKEPVQSNSQEHVKHEMKAFVARQGSDYGFIFQEASDVSEGGFSLADFIEHFDVIMEYNEEQSAKYRQLYLNSDGTAGQKICEYIIFLLSC